MSAELYHNRVLELAANIPHVGRLEDADASVEKVSRVCGSIVRVDVKLSEDGDTVEAVAVDPRACALGQAATSVLAEHIIGAEVDEVFAARDALRAMLKDGAEPPEGRFAELRHLQGVADYPPRHTSTMLAFEAACDAIETARTNRAAAAPSAPAVAG
ncbi:MAG: iron-sulfur cluster assembly scaffold protein [Henriciella sp.]|uniref:iron-sulfur cluster assembly scaffold protein n=1 Tax=Henriciella sp. TaxID=1968823 RepID=UPI003C720E1F